MDEEIGENARGRSVIGVPRATGWQCYYYAARIKTRNHGIFCLEGEWWGNLSKNSSMEPMLELLSHSPQRRLRYIHRNVATPSELDEYLRIWTQRMYKSYPVLYLGFHGYKGGILVGDQRKPDKVTFDRLGQSLANKCEGKIIHFGSCETLDWHGKRLDTFMKETGAACVTGYKNPVDWLPSAAFELFRFQVLQKTTFTKISLAKIERKLIEQSGGLGRKLGFRIRVNPG